MDTGAITEYIDVAQLVLYAFWIFFAGLIYYLHQENKREGYPLESNVPGRNKIVGFPPMPAPKTYLLPHGGTMTVPRPAEVAGPLGGTPMGAYPGAPVDPRGPAARLGIGPGAYAARRDTPDLTIDGAPRIVPLRTADDFKVSAKDVDPRGLPVLGADLFTGGVVRDIWVDRSEVLFRYLEVEVAAASDAASGERNRVLLPINFSRIGSRQIVVDSIMARDFANVPRTRDPDTVTLLEEEKIVAYYGAGTLYAHPRRAEPLL